MFRHLNTLQSHHDADAPCGRAGRVKPGYRVDIFPGHDALQAYHPYSLEVQWLGQLTGNPIREPYTGIGVHKYNQVLARSVGRAAFAIFVLYRFQDQRFRVLDFACALAGNHNMLGRPCCIGRNILNDAVSANRVATEGKPIFARLEIDDDAKKPIHQDLAGPHVTEALERLSALQVPSAADEGLNLLQADLQAFEAGDAIFHKRLEIVGLLSVWVHWTESSSALHHSPFSAGARKPPTILVEKFPSGCGLLIIGRSKWWRWRSRLTRILNMRMKSSTAYNGGLTVPLPSTREEARAQGLDRFFTGAPCIHGHIAPRYVSTTNCVQCQAEHARRLGGWKVRPSKEEYLKKVRDKVEKEWNGVLLSTEYVSAKSKLNIQCAQGHLFSSCWSDLKQGKWCRKCFGGENAKRQAAKRRTVEELRKFARIEHEGDCLATSPVSMTTKVRWKCKNPLHEPFSARLLNVIHQGTWCPECEAERKRLYPPKPQISQKYVEDRVKLRHGVIVEILGDGRWKGLKTRLKLRCANGHTWDADAHNLVHAESWCPDCPRRNGEKIVRAIFEATFNSKFPNCRPRWLEKETGRKLELDGYSESLQLAFEYQGPHHFTDDDVRERDSLKRQACMKRGVRLVEIDWTKNRFQFSNVLTNVGRALVEAGIPELPLMPVEDPFRAELEELLLFAKQRGGSLISTVYGGVDEPHEWHCGNSDHPRWMANPWSVTKRGQWCPSCAGNRPLGLEGLHTWGEGVGLELLDLEYQGTNHSYNWRCRQAQHSTWRRKGDIEESLEKGYPACSTCSPGFSVNIRARKKGADEFATSMQSIIDGLKKEGYLSLDSIAHQLNKRQIPTRFGGNSRWYASTVKNVLDRSKGLSEAQTEEQ